MLLFVCFQGKAGVCHISDCLQFGKFLKRLDNHFLASQPGVMKGENDNKPLKLMLVNKTCVKCLLHGCEKEVIHFKQHLKNRHKMGMEDYIKKISEKEAEVFYEPSTSSQSLTTSEIPGSTPSTSESLAPVQYPSPPLFVNHAHSLFPLLTYLHLPKAQYPRVLLHHHTEFSMQMITKSGN